MKLGWALAGVSLLGVHWDIAASSVGGPPIRHFGLLNSPSTLNRSVDIQATYDERSRVLSIAGSKLGDWIKLTAGRDGTILVNDGVVPIKGGTPTLEKVYDVVVFGGDGDDVLTSEIGRVVMYGDAGLDFLIWDNGEKNFYASLYEGDWLIYNDDREEAPLGGYYDKDLLLVKTDDGFVVEGQDGSDLLSVSQGDGSN